MKKKEIYERIYDNPKNKDGSMKSNRLLGIFRIEKQIMEDFYAEEFIGKRQEDGKQYLVKGIEVSGLYYPNQGGVKYQITNIN